jgi:hypothetical protein
MPDWLTGSIVLAALLTAAVTLQSSERKISIEYVTGERAKWREKIREKALEVYRAANEEQWPRLRELQFEFTLLLNPDDAADNKILDVIDRLSKKEPALPEFARRVSYLLKHDWERAKSEAEPFWRRTKPPERKPGEPTTREVTPQNPLQ